MLQSGVTSIPVKVFVGALDDDTEIADRFVGKYSVSAKYKVFLFEVGCIVEGPSMILVPLLQDVVKEQIANQRALILGTAGDKDLYLDEQTKLAPFMKFQFPRPLNDSQVLQLTVLMTPAKHTIHRMQEVPVTVYLSKDASADVQLAEKFVKQYALSSDLKVLYCVLETKKAAYRLVIVAEQSAGAN